MRVSIQITTRDGGYGMNEGYSSDSDTGILAVLLMLDGLAKSQPCAERKHVYKTMRDLVEEYAKRDTMEKTLTLIAFCAINLSKGFHDWNTEDVMRGRF